MSMTPRSLVARKDSKFLSCQTKYTHGYHDGNTFIGLIDDPSHDLHTVGDASNETIASTSGNCHDDALFT